MHIYTVLYTILDTNIYILDTNIYNIYNIYFIILINIYIF